jgi:hypothetical protein
VQILGGMLVALSALSVVQTVREIALWQSGRQAYDEVDPRVADQQSFVFAGHTVSVADDQPMDSVYSQAEYEGTIQPFMDGRPLAAPSRALVRRGLDDMGRYHFWFDAWVFRARSGGPPTLWLARRLQATDAATPRFEVITVATDGTHQTRVFRAWQLGTDYRLRRATQFVADGEWMIFPLSLGGVLGFFPPLLLIFPIGTAVAGALLFAWGTRARRHDAAA